MQQYPYQRGNVFPQYRQQSVSNQYGQQQPPQPMTQYPPVSNQYGQQPLQPPQPPQPVPNQYGQQPPQPVPNQYGQQPPQYPPMPNQYGQYPPQYPPMPNQYGQQPPMSHMYNTKMRHMGLIGRFINMLDGPPLGYWLNLLAVILIC